MDSEPPQIDTPPRQREPLPKSVWVLVALSPSAITLIAAVALLRDINPRWLISTLLLIDVLLSIVGSVGILRKPGNNKIALVVGVIFLGGFFAVLNAGIGIFTGCCAVGVGGGRF